MNWFRSQKKKVFTAPYCESQVVCSLDQGFLELGIGYCYHSSLDDICLIMGTRIIGMVFAKDKLG